MYEIYTMGNSQALETALRGLAAIFGNGRYVDSTNALGLGSNMELALLLALMWLLISGLRDQKFEAGHILVGVVAFSVFFVPKTTVQVINIDGTLGSFGAIDDVPIGVALVGSFASNMSYNLTSDLETYFSTPDRTASALTQNGFLDPLKTLISLRYAVMEKASPSVWRNYKRYIEVCVEASKQNPGATFVQTDYEKATNTAAYLFDPTKIKEGLMQYYTMDTGDETLLPCRTIATEMKLKLEAVAGAGADSVLVNSAIERNSKDGRIGRTAQEQVQGMLNALMSTGVDGTDFMVNMFIYNADRLYAAGDGASAGLTLEAAVRSQTTQQAAMDSATQGSAFLYYMFPTMQLTQFVFYSIAPLIAFLVVGGGPMSMKFLGSYMLVGIWAHMWLPIAALINMFCESSIYTTMQSFKNGVGYASGSLSLNQYYALYDECAKYLTVGSQGLAMTPTIVAGLLTAGAFALSRMGDISGAASRRAAEATSMSSPALQNVAPVNTVQSRNSLENMHRTQVGGQIIQTNGNGLVKYSENATHIGQDQIALQNSIKAASSNIQANKDEISKDLIAGKTDRNSTQITDGFSTTTGSGNRVNVTDSATTAEQLNKQFGHTEGTESGANGGIGANLWLANGEVFVRTSQGWKDMKTVANEYGSKHSGEDQVSAEQMKRYLQDQGYSASGSDEVSAKVAQIAADTFTKQKLEEKSSSLTKSQSEIFSQNQSGGVNSEISSVDLARAAQNSAIRSVNSINGKLNMGRMAEQGAGWSQLQQNLNTLMGTLSERGRALVLSRANGMQDIINGNDVNNDVAKRSFALAKLTGELLSNPNDKQFEGLTKEERTAIASAGAAVFQSVRDDTAAQNIMAKREDVANLVADGVADVRKDVAGVHIDGVNSDTKEKAVSAGRFAEGNGVSTPTKVPNGQNPEVKAAVDEGGQGVQSDFKAGKSAIEANSEKIEKAKIAGNPQQSPLSMHKILYGDKGVSTQDMKVISDAVSDQNGVSEASVDEAIKGINERFALNSAAGSPLDLKQAYKARLDELNGTMNYSSQNAGKAKALAMMQAMYDVGGTFNGFNAEGDGKAPADMAAAAAGAAKVEGIGSTSVATATAAKDALAIEAAESLSRLGKVFKGAAVVGAVATTALEAGQYSVNDMDIRRGLVGERTRLMAGNISDISSEQRSQLVTDFMATKSSLGDFGETAKASIGFGQESLNDSINEFAEFASQKLGRTADQLKADIKSFDAPTGGNYR